jgi:hypothetical protein
MKNGLIIINGSDKFWYKDDKLHREDGPAVEFATTGCNKWWYQHGKIHREDGPAVECSDGTKYWWYHGNHIKCKNQQEFERKIKLKAFW